MAYGLREQEHTTRMTLEPVPQTGSDQPADTPSPLTGAGRAVYVAGAVALTEPGPAAAGLVVTDEGGRVLARRAHYLGRATRIEATARALLTGLYVALDEAMLAPTLRVDEPALVDALEQHGAVPAGTEGLIEQIRAVRARLGTHRLETIRPSANPARPIALTPLVEWLPERTRRAERLRVRRVGVHTYDVASETQPGQTYRVWLRRPDGTDEPFHCECGDFQYRGLPCKHLLAVAREEGALEEVFRADAGAFSRPSEAATDEHPPERA
jgi:SWIM zinc finger/Reverse transcriptase-like